MPNLIGRWIAANFDFRFSGLASLFVVAVFILLKFRRDPSVPRSGGRRHVDRSLFASGRGYYHSFQKLPQAAQRQKWYGEGMTC